MVELTELVIDNPSVTQYLSGLSADVPVSLRFRLVPSSAKGAGDVLENLGSADVKIIEAKTIEMLKRMGIDAVSDVSEAAASTQVAVVKGNNVELPFMAPETANRLAERLEKVFEKEQLDVAGYFYPVTMKQLVRPGSVNKKLEVANPNRYDEIIKARTADFVSSLRVEAQAKARPFDAFEADTVGSQNRSLWRGGYVGGQAHAVVTGDYAKSCCYASSRLDVAVGYGVNDGAFVYEYERTPGQKFTNDWGLEKRYPQMFSDEYETAVFPHRNKLKNIYIPFYKDEQFQLFPIPLEDKRWQDFLELYTPTEELSPAHTIRRNAQLDNPAAAVTHYDFIKGQIVEEVPPYRAADLKAVYGDKVTIGTDGKVVINGDVDLRGIRIQDMENLKVTGRLALSQIGDALPEAGSLDLRSCRNVDLTGKDLSRYAHVFFPDDTKDLKGLAGLPKRVDLNTCYDFKIAGNTKLLKQMDSVDWALGTTVEFDGSDVSHLRPDDLNKFFRVKFSRIKLPKNIGEMNWALGSHLEFEKSDLSRLTNANFGNALNVTFLSGTTLPSDSRWFRWPRDVVLNGCDLSRVSYMNLSGCNTLKISGDTKLPKNMENIVWAKNVEFGEYNLARLSNFDFRECNVLKISDKAILPQDLSKFVWPQTVEMYADLSHVKRLNLAGCDVLKMSARTKLPQDLSHFTWPRTLDLTACDLSHVTNMNLSGCELLKISGQTKLPDVINGFQLPKNLKLIDCDLSQIARLDLSGCDTMTVSGKTTFPDNFKRITWPKNVVLNGCDLSKMSQLDLSACDSVTFSNTVTLPGDLSQVKLPKNIRLDGSSSYFLNKMDLSSFDTISCANLHTLDGCNLSKIKQLDLSECRHLSLSHNVFPDDASCIAWPKQLELEGCDLSRVQNLNLSDCAVLKIGVHTRLPANLNGIVWPKTVDLSACSLFQLKGMDFGACDVVRFPKNVPMLEGVQQIKWPKKGIVDLSDCYFADFIRADFSACESVKLSRQTKLPTDVSQFKWPKNVDLSNIDLSKATGWNFGACETVKFSAQTKFPTDMRAITWPKNMDLSACDFSKVSGLDLTGCETVKFSAQTKFPTDMRAITWPKTVDLTACDLLKMAGANFRSCEKVVLGPLAFGHLSDIVLPENGIVDLSACERISLSNDIVFPKDMRKIIWPKNGTVDLVHCNLSDLSGADFGACKEVSFPPHMTTLKGVQLPRNVILSECHGVNLNGMDFSTCEMVRFPKNTTLLENVILPEKAHFNGCESVTFGRGTKFPADLTHFRWPETVDLSACRNLDLKGVHFADGCVKLPADMTLEKLRQIDTLHNPDFTACRDLDFNQIDMTQFKKVVLPEGTDLSLTQRARCKLKGVQIEYAPVSAVVAEDATVKAATKTATHTAVNAATDGAAKKSGGVLGVLAKANAAYDNAFDAAIDKTARVLNDSAVGRVYDKAATAVGHSKVGRVVGKAADAVARTKPAQVVTKVVTKTAGTTVGKSILKKIPVVSLGAGCYFAYERFKKGEWFAGCAEVASGTLGCLPGLGTAASTAIDVGLVANDITTESQKAAPENTPTKAPTPAPTEKPRLSTTIDVTALASSLEPDGAKLAQSGQNITKEGEQKTDDNLTKGATHAR